MSLRESWMFVSEMSIDLRARTMSVRWASATRTAASTSGAGPIGGTLSVGSTRSIQKSARFGSMMSVRSTSSAVRDVRARHDQRLAPLRHLGARGNQIQRRRLPDVHARPVRPLELERQVERALLDLHQRARGDELPVAALGACRR